MIVSVEINSNKTTQFLFHIFFKCHGSSSSLETTNVCLTLCANKYIKWLLYIIIIYRYIDVDADYWIEWMSILY